MEQKEWGIGIHKELNRSPVQFDSARMIDVYYNIVQRFNYQLTPSINITKEELYKIARFEDQYREKEVQSLIGELTKSTVFNIPEGNGRKISGSVFTARFEEDETITIWVSEPYRPYIFHKDDIDLINKVKKGTIELNETEKDRYESVVKEKKQFLLLLNQAELEGIRSKYGKRLYSILVQYHLKNKLLMTISDFKEIMEIPETYTLGKMNGVLLKRVKEELESKGLFKFLDEKKGSGRRKITHIEINFEYLGKYKAKKSKEELEKEELEKKFKVKYDKVFFKCQKMQMSKPYVLREFEENPIKTMEELEKFIEKYEIIIL